MEDSVKLHGSIIPRQTAAPSIISGPAPQGTDDNNEMMAFHMSSRINQQQKVKYREHYNMSQKKTPVQITPKGATQKISGFQN